MAIDNNQVVRVAARFNLGGQTDQVNVFYFRAVLDDTVEDEDFVDGLTDFVKDNYYNLVDEHANDVVGQDMKIDCVLMEDGKVVLERPLGVYAWPTAYTGTDTTDLIPHGAALLALLRTGLPRTLGKKFFGGFCEASTAGTGSWGATLLADAAAMVANLIVNYPIGTGMAVRGVVPSKYGNVFTNILSVVLKAIPAYQRRRKPGVGS